MFCAGGGFLFGAVAGYAIKKVMKIAAVVIGLFVAALSCLSYKGSMDIKWVAMENITRSALTNVPGQVVDAYNYTASQFAPHPLVVSTSGLPIAAGFVPGLLMVFKKGQKMIKIDTIFTGRICMSVALVLTTSRSLLANCEIVHG